MFPSLPQLAARRVLKRDRRGSSSPVIVDTDQGPFLLKLRGAAQGPAALVAEVIVAGLADRIGLAVPGRAVVTLEVTTPTDDRNDELADLLAASVGENLGFQYLERARSFRATDLAEVGPDWASQVRWLDWLVLNPDRSAANPNILIEGQKYWLIDHGAALPFHHDWAAVTEQTPQREEAPVPHLFGSAASRLTEWDPILTSMFDRGDLVAAVELVPESFLSALLGPSPTSEQIRRRRAGYVAFLWKRLRREHHFRSEDLNSPSPRVNASHSP